MRMSFVEDALSPERLLVADSGRPCEGAKITGPIVEVIHGVFSTLVNRAATKTITYRPKRDHSTRVGPHP